MSLAFTPEQGYVILTSAAVGLHCYIQGGAVSSLRKKYGIEYPDMGSGRYSVKLTEEQWFKFNCAQRAHQNYLEVLPMILSWLLIGGLKYPLYAVGFGVTTIVGRQFYSMGYRNTGPKGRSLGAGISAIGLIGLLVTTITTGLKYAQLL